MVENWTSLLSYFLWVLFKSTKNYIQKALWRNPSSLVYVTKVYIVVEVLHVLTFTFAIEGKALVVVEVLHVLTFTFAIETSMVVVHLPNVQNFKLIKSGDEISKCFPFALTNVVTLHQMGIFAIRIYKI